jgi:archaellum component FlaG (FlaF/FlaG flagellin family)
MNNVTGRNLNWFFNSWFFTNGYNDIAIASPVKGKDGYTITVKNIGGFPIPFDVVLTFADGSTQTIHKTPAIWEANQKEALVTFKAAVGKNLKSVTLDNGIYVDATKGDNIWTL